MVGSLRSSVGVPPISFGFVEEVKNLFMPLFHGVVEDAKLFEQLGFHPIFCFPGNDLIGTGRRHQRNPTVELSLCIAPLITVIDLLESFF